MVSNWPLVLRGLSLFTVGLVDLAALEKNKCHSVFIGLNEINICLNVGLRDRIIYLYDK